MRPFYETQNDLDLEQIVMKKFCAYKGYTSFEKCSLEDRLDFSFYHNKELCGFAEIKVRKNLFNKYPTYMISLTKLQAAWSLSKKHKKPCYLVVAWKDCIGIVDMFSRPYVDVGGRTDRNDAADIEIVCHYNINQFDVFASWSIT